MHLTMAIPLPSVVVYPQTILAVVYLFVVDMVADEVVFNTKTLLVVMESIVVDVVAAKGVHE